MRAMRTVRAVKAAAHWLPGWGRRLSGDGEDQTDGGPGREGREGREGRVGRISRTADGRFVLDRLRDSLASQSSSSDDGGFLARRSRLRSGDRASWRRPLVAYPSELSLRSDGTGQSNLRYVRDSPFYRIATPTPSPRPPQSPLQTIYTPRLLASSPANSTPLWSPPYNFSDLSSVPVASSAERSLRSVHERYSQELPSLRAIHAEPLALFVPAQSSPPRIRIPAQWAELRRSRLPPRHARHARSAPELTALEAPGAAPGLLMETSPESRSSSSGFGSKNTSQQNQSSQSGSTAEPALPLHALHPLHPCYIPAYPYYTGYQGYPGYPGYAVTPPASSELQPPFFWLDFATASPASVGTKADGHYEFDAGTPTPPIRLRPEEGTATLGPDRWKRPARTDNIEARVQAMKEEFYRFRRRQEKRRRSEELESAC